MSESNPVAATSVPSVARAYDYVLGGKDNFEIDRTFAQEIMKRDPEVRMSAAQNRDLGRRVTDYCARRGIRQFLDLGSGIPTSPPSIHETARAIDRSARVVYVDHDPVVTARNRALRAIGPGLVAIEADFTDPQTLFAREEVNTTLDLSEPVAVFMLSVLQNTLEHETAKALIADIRSQLAPGSYLAISHISARLTPQEVKDQIAFAIEKTGYPATVLRTPEQLRELFDDFELLDPGIVDFRDCLPDEDADRPQLRGLQFEAGVAVLR